MTKDKNIIVKMTEPEITISSNFYLRGTMKDNRLQRCKDSSGTIIQKELYVITLEL